MELVVASHPLALDHDTSRNHPERPARVIAVRNGLEDSSLRIHDIVSPEARLEDLTLVHDPEYVDMVQAFCSMGGGALDMDTIVSPASWGAALRAAGGVLAAVEELGGRSDASAFVLARPPGHHALRDRAMGFCLFNNVAIAAARIRRGGETVAILDWDVHHGNGTEALVRDDEGILYVSLHQANFYPFEGFIDSLDSDNAGTVFNIPLVAGTAGDVYREAWETLVMPVIDQFAPDWVLVSAGYDGHEADQLAGLRLVSDDFGFMSGVLAEHHPPNRTVFVLEGGYDVDALRQSAEATVEGLRGGFEAGAPLGSPVGAEDNLLVAREVAARYFSF